MGSYSSVDNPPTSQGCELCPNEKAQAQQECDPGGYQIDLTTCEYTCDCTVEHAAKVQECGGITHIKSYDYSTCTGECDCSALKFAKEAECGGAEYLENWNEETCTGNCYCENDDGTPKGPLSVSYSQLSGFCGGVSKVESWNKLTCSGECGDCSDEYAELETQCGVAGVDRDTWVESTCSGECKLDCSVELAAKETECGIEGVDMSTWSDQTCTGECRKSCTEEMNSLEDKCGIAGVDNESFDFQECTGKCNDCETKTKSCSKECGGFVASYNCRENADGNGNITGIVDDQCECGKPELLVGGGDDAIPQPGDAGGNVTPNPDGSHDETLPDGTVIHYSKNGLSVTIERPDGSTYNRTWSQNSEGQWVHSDISTDAEGNWRKTEETALTDGQGTVETVTNGHNDIPGTNHEVVDNTTTNTHTDPPDTQPEDNEPETSEEAEGKQDADVSITSVGHITKPSSVQKNYVQAHQIDTSVFSQSVQAFSDTGPAQLAGGMVDLLQELVADPVAPRFEIPIAEWEMVIDLSVMDPVAAIARVLEMIILIMGTMFLLLRQWRAN